MSFAQNKTNEKLHIDNFSAILFWCPGTGTQARLGYQYSTDGLYSKSLFQITMGSMKELFFFTLQKRKY